jgi:hypothetical protein
VKRWWSEKERRKKERKNTNISKAVIFPEKEKKTINILEDEEEF